MTLTRLTVSAVLMTCTLLFVAGASGTAQAQHASRGYTGQRVGLHGESRPAVHVHGTRHAGFRHPGSLPVVVAPKSYCYTGECFEFHGESHVIEALRWMDQALLANCPLDRIQATDRARRQLLLAHQEFCDRDAKREVLAAVRALNRFVGTRQACDLDEAAATALLALDLERHVHVRVGGHGGQLGRHPHGRQNQDFRSITLGNENFRIRIGF